MSIELLQDYNVLNHVFPLITYTQASWACNWCITRALRASLIHIPSVTWFVRKGARCLSMMAVIVIIINIKNQFFCETFYIHKRQKNQSCLCTEYRDLSWAIKYIFCIFEKKVNNSIAKKLCVNLINNRKLFL